MTSSRPAPRALVVLPALLLASHTLVAQQDRSRSGEYRPVAGQPGKDVVWVPTPEGLVERMLQLAGVGSDDYVIDLGSGDGRTVIMAAERFGARALGIEYNPDLVALSRRDAELAGATALVEFVQADIFESDFSQATVITLYLTPGINLKLRSRLLELRPGTRVVSHDFRMAAWQPDEKVTFEGRDAYLWVVPADVAGTWKLTLPTEENEETWTLALDQRFQTVSGRVRLFNEQEWLDVTGSLRGAEVRLQFTDASGRLRVISGRVFSDRIDGTVDNGAGTSLRWRAVPR